MARKTSKLAAATAVAAAFSLTAAPVSAVELPRPHAPTVYDANADNAQRHRDHYDDWDDDDWDIDAGDVIAGVVVLGALAAIFGGSTRQQQQRPYPEPEPYPDDAGYEVPGRADRYGGSGIAAAVDSCVSEVEYRGERIGSVAGANRDGEGWYVSGELENGSMFWCRLDSDGAVSEVGGPGIGYAEPSEQYDDDYYDEARQQQLGKEQAGSFDGG